MVNKMKFILLLFLFSNIASYGQQLISYVSLNTDKAYIGQPVQMTVSVYTNTWFTSGIDVGNINIEGALTVYFRSVSNIRKFSGKQFAGVDFIYNVFPTKAGELIIPELTIHVETPKPGDYKGAKRIVKTKSKVLNVNDVPAGYDPNNWLVSSSLNITEKWNTSLDNVKVGDVLQRSIKRFAGGTLSEFIPAQQWDSVPGVSIYPTRPKVNTNKSKTNVSAERIEMVNYLFEKEGAVVLPKMEYVYWNFRNKKFYIKVIDSVVIDVAANADLEMLESIKKQLEQNTEEQLQEEEKPFLILGMSPKRFLFLLIVSLVLLYIAIRVTMRLMRWIKSKYDTYLNSESYRFKNVLKTLNRKAPNAFFNNLKIWMLQLDMDTNTFDSFLKHYGTPDLIREYSNLKSSLFDHTMKNSSVNYSALSEALKESRKQYFNGVLIKDSKKTDWLNPIK